jgi:glycerol-3-phosphate acyltransferase PlsY
VLKAKGKVKNKALPSTGECCITCSRIATLAHNWIMSMSLPPFPAVSGKELTTILVCYLLGCFTAGYYWVRWRTGADLRDHGSGNLGARNAGRVLGFSGFVATLLLDVAKGALAVGMALYCGLRPELVVAAMLAVVVGHNWPMQLRFQGGKGIATTFGVLLAYDSFLVAILLALFLPCFALLRNFTLAGLLAFALSPFVVFLCGLENMEVVATSLLAILILVSHRKNIRGEFARLFSPPLKDAPISGAAEQDHEL